MSPTVPVLDAPAAVPTTGDSPLRSTGVLGTVLSTFLQSVAGASVSGSHHSIGLVQQGLYNASTVHSGGTAVFDYETELEETSPPGQPNNHTQTVVDILAVFGAMLVAGVAIILISVYISKVRKRQSNATPSLDAESPTSRGSDGVASVNGTSSSASSLSQHTLERHQHGSTVHLNKEDEWGVDFGTKPSLWRKTMRSVLLRLRGQEQHKDVYVMPAHMRNQLKQMYVY